MSWIYERWSVPSALNGKIDCTRVMGQWTVLVDGTNESSGYIRDMWRGALQRIPGSVPVKRILLLGLAAGSSIELFHRRFPGCRVTAVEWDPVMVEVMDRLRLFKPSHRPEILLGDALQVVPKLREKFDLIVFDLYQGPVTPDGAKQRSFFELLRPLMHRESYLLLNAYQQSEMLETAAQCLSTQSSWKFRYNWLAAYRPFGAGTIGDPLPAEYAPFRSSRAYLKRDVRSEPNASLEGLPDVPGTRRWQGPFCIEKYYGDQEPLIDGTGPKRLVIWQPTQRANRPDGWGRSWIQMNAEITGFVDLAVPNPYATWSPHVKRHLKRWLSQADAWESVEVSLDEYLAAYRTSTMRSSLKDLFGRILAHKKTSHGERMHFFALKRRSTGLIEAGFASLDIPELHQAIHIASFFLDSARDDAAGTGLIYNWFKDGERRGIRFLDFDLFRGKTDPKSWEGFSRFKAQFGTYFIHYPYPLTRWTGTWREWFATLTRRSG